MLFQERILLTPPEADPSLPRRAASRRSHNHSYQPHSRRYSAGRPSDHSGQSLLVPAHALLVLDCRYPSHRKLLKGSTTDALSRWAHWLVVCQMPQLLGRRVRPTSGRRLDDGEQCLPSACREQPRSRVQILGMSVRCCCAA